MRKCHAAGIRIGFLLLALLLCAALAGCSAGLTAKLTVFAFSAGAADAFLITTENSAVLIDCGERSFGKEIAAYLTEQRSDSPVRGMNGLQISALRVEGRGVGKCAYRESLGIRRFPGFPIEKRRDEKGVNAVMCQRGRCLPPGAPWPEGPPRFGPPLLLPPEGPCSGMCRGIRFRSGSGRRIVRRGARGVGSRRGRKFR